MKSCVVEEEQDYISTYCIMQFLLLRININFFFDLTNDRILMYGITLLFSPIRKFASLYGIIDFEFVFESRITIECRGFLPT